MIHEDVGEKENIDFVMFERERKKEKRKKVKRTKKTDLSLI